MSATLDLAPIQEKFVSPLPMLERWVPTGSSPVPPSALRSILNPPAPKPAAPSEPKAPAEGIRTTLLNSGTTPHSPWSTPAWEGSPTVVNGTSAAYGKKPTGMPKELPALDEGMDGIRKLIFGKHIGEMQTKVAELQLSLNGEVSRMKDAIMKRVDEMAALLHRDMVVLRQETQREIEQLKTDVFTAATEISMTKDRLSQIETRNSEQWAAATTDLDQRLTQQSTTLGITLETLESRLTSVMNTEIATALGKTIPAAHMSQLLVESAERVTNEDTELQMAWFTMPAPATARAPSAEAFGIVG